MKLIKEEYVDKNLPKGWLPYYIYQIIVDHKTVGKIVLREGSIEEHYYDGHIGYSIDEKYRGHNYAYQAMLLLNKEALMLGFDIVLLIIFLRKKTILKLNAKYLETVTIPSKLKKDFGIDEKQKEVYILELRR